MARKEKNTRIDVDALRHEDMRSNIPTNELRDFVGDDEINPVKLRYPRDTSLDPQLVWNGKDEQDENLEVLAVPIYIQEKVQPQAIIEEVRKQAATKAGNNSDLPQQLNLFNDFNGIEFEELIEFYQHQQHWQNRLILGDSLMVMGSLAEKEGLKGKVQMIYFDPPYGIKFGSNWQVSTRKRDVKDGREEDLVRQPEQIRAFRDTWEKGIHSYLNYLRDRLVLTRELLTESGSIFVQISDDNVHLVRNLMDEVFGSENFCGQIHFKSTTGQTSELLSLVGDYLIWYAKDRSQIKYHQLYIDKDNLASGVRLYTQFEDGFRSSFGQDEISENNPSKFFVLDNLTSQSGGETTKFSVNFEGRKFSSGQGFWKTNAKGMERLSRARRLGVSGSTLRYVRFTNDFPVSPLNVLWTDTSTGGFTDPKVYVVQTNTKIVQRCMLMTTDPGDLVLDPTCGSGTTAYVAEQWGRRWITIDTARVALTLARTRLMSARFPYYLLADSPEGAEQEVKLSGKLQPLRQYNHNIKQGFVYERLPHITLRDIANNEAIDVIHERWQLQLEERRLWLDETLDTNWEEWEIPRELPNDLPVSESDAEEIHNVLADYWQIRRQRQAEIDESIQNNCDYEVLYDRPSEDKRKVRVTGPFTVESLSPHRILDPAYAEAAARQNMANIGSYEQMVIDNLLIAGVQNSYREERLKFDSIEPYAGIWLHATGYYTDKHGNERRVAVSIGSEHGTVGARHVKEAAKEAVKGLGFDLLLICGFAFDAVVSEESKRYNKLDIQIVRMNSDLMMGSVLKQTDRANLFTIFGEPDIQIEQEADGRYVVDIRGLDIYDPTTGQIRSSSTDDVACWFIDTAYNEESFFVRHAYFLGQADNYEKLKKALKSEIDEDAWQMLYSSRSMPFERPENGRIAIKVINHYGDEVLKVYSL